MHEIFGTNIRAIVPQLAMSGGTMIACSCNTIIIGKQSSLGPIDPQIMGVPAHAVLEEFKRAKDEITENPLLANVWQPILSKYPPTFIIGCEKSIEWSEQILDKSLKYSMFNNDENNEVIQSIKDELAFHDNTKNHGRYLNAKRCSEIGLKIENMEDDDELQDLILSIHYACINYFNLFPVVKLFSNQMGKFLVQNIKINE